MNFLPPPSEQSPHIRTTWFHLPRDEESIPNRQVLYVHHCTRCHIPQQRIIHYRHCESLRFRKLQYCSALWHVGGAQVNICVIQTRMERTGCNIFSEKYSKHGFLPAFQGTLTATSCSRVWAASSRYICQLLANTDHTNTAYKLYTLIFYFPLHVSAIHIDHLQVECRYGRKSATEEVCPVHST